MVTGQVLSRFGELNRSTIRRKLVSVLFISWEGRVLGLIIYVTY